MAQAYTRQSSFSDGDSITAALFNNEYNQLVNVFAYSSSSASSTGHRHDGTVGEGGNIFKIGDLDFLNKVEIDSTNNRIGFYTEVSSAAVEQLRIQDGALVPVTDSDIDLGTTLLRFKDTFTDSITTTGNVSVGGNLTVTGTTTFNGGTITMGDADTDNVVFGANVDSSIIPDDDNTHDLGSSSQQWRNLYVDGTAYVDSINLNESTITATATELNLLDGVTATTTELNYVDVTTAGTVEASKAVVADSNADVLFSDNDKLKFGTGSDLQLYHDGTHSYAANSTGSFYLRTASSLQIENSDGSEDLATFAVNGAATLFHDNSAKLATTSTGVTVSGGTSSTLLIDASTHDSSTANTAILNFGFGHSGSPDATGFIKLTENGTNSFNGTMTFGLPKSNGSGGSTTNTVLTIDQDGDTTFTGDVTLTGASADIVFDKSDNALEFATNAKAVFGGSLSISRIGNSSYIHETGSGDLYIKGSDIIFTDADNNQFIHLDDDGTGGTVRLKHEGSTKISTTSTGVDVTGTVVADGLTVDSGTTNTVATFTSTDAGAGLNLTDNSGTSTIQTNGANLRIGVDDDGAVASSAIQFRVDGSTKATINDSGVLDVDGGITVDNITIDGTEIDLSSGDLTLDVAGNIVLDADGGQIQLTDAGTNIGLLQMDSSQNLIFRSMVQDKDIQIKGNDGGSTVTAVTFDMSNSGRAVFNAGAGFFDHVNFSDNAKAVFGDGDDLQIYHDGHSNIVDNGTGNLRLFGNSQIFFGRSVGGEAYATFNSDSSVNLYFNNVIKFETASDGIDIKGVAATTFGLNIIDPSSSTHGAHFSFDDFNSKVLIGGVTSGTKNTAISIPRDSTQVDFGTHITFPDNGRIKLGQASDLQIYHDGSNSFIQDAGTGDLIVRASNNLYLQSYSGAENYLVATTDGAVELYHDNSKKIETTSGGISVTGNVALTGDIQKTGQITLDASTDIALDTDSGTILFKDNGVNKGRITTVGDIISIVNATQDGDIKFDGLDGSSSITALRLDMSEGGTATFNNGVVVQGDLTVQGTTVTLNTATLDVEDKNITLNAGSGDTSGSANGAGITIQDAVDASTDASLTWRASDDKFIFSHKLRMFDDLELPDSVKLVAGDGNDLQIYHDGNNSVISETGTGSLKMMTGALLLRTPADADMMEVQSGGAITLFHNAVEKLKTFSGGIDVSGVVYTGGSTAQTVGIGASMGDVNAAELGPGYLNLARDDTADAKQILFEKNDVEHSSITTKASSLDIASEQAIVLDSAGDITIDADGGDIYLHDAGTRFAYFSNSSTDFFIGVNAQDKDIFFKGNDGGSGITALRLDMSDAGTATFNHDIVLGDNGRVKFGDAGDMAIFHNATDTFIQNSTGSLIIENTLDDSDIVLKSDDGSGGTAAYLTLDGSAVTTFFNKNTRHTDNIRATFGNSSDLQIYHDGSDSYIKEDGTGNLIIAADDFRVTNVAVDEVMIGADTDGVVSLYHNGSAKLQTTSSGVTVTGTVAGDVVSAHTTENTVANDDVIAFYDTSAGAIRKTAVSNLPGGSTGSSAADDITTGDAAVTIGTSSGDITLDTPGDIILDADGGDIRFKDAGTEIGVIENSSSDLQIKASVQDKDIIFRGNDGGSGINALTLDMSAGGTAQFAHDIEMVDNGLLRMGAGGDLILTSDGTHGSIYANNGNLTIDVADNIFLDADGGNIGLKDAGTQWGNFANNGGDFEIDSLVQDKDIKFNGNDGGSTITALTLDMSEAGAATFNNNVTAFSDERLKDNIETLEDGLAKVEQLRGVTYTRDSKENIGVIAQEIEKILPEIVLTADDEMGTKSVDYSRITAVLIEAVKELSVRVKELENK